MCVLTKAWRLGRYGYSAGCGIWTPSEDREHAGGLGRTHARLAQGILAWMDMEGRYGVGIMGQDLVERDNRTEPALVRS